MKQALLIGINYKNTPEELNGCINDILEVQSILRQQYNYTDFTILTDDTIIKPTKVNILNSLKKIVSNSSLCQEIWIHYSGHGTSVKDLNRDEADGFDEALVPLDFQSNGLIIDDDLKNIISTSKCNTRIILDCCHSGSALDLYYNVKTVNNKLIKYYEGKNNLSILKNNIFMISGCMDNQTSADSSDPLKKIAMGAMTSAFLRTLKKNNYKITVSELMKQLNGLLILEGYSQRPIFSSNKDINLDSLYIISSTSSRDINETYIFEEVKQEEVKQEEVKQEDVKQEYDNDIWGKLWNTYGYIINFIAKLKFW
jgi:hypothetical protein